MVDVRPASSLSPELQVVGMLFAAGSRVLNDGGLSIDDAFLAEVGFEGRAGQVQVLRSGDRSIIAVGIGPAEGVTTDAYRRAAAQFVKAASKFSSAALLASDHSQAVAEGLSLGAYSFTTYKSKVEPPKLTTVDVVGADADALGQGVMMAEAVKLARDLINTPAADMTPTRLAEIAVEVTANEGVRTEVWDEGRIASERLGGLLGVAAGSDQPPRLVKMVFEPSPAATRTIALVGKGITFDSGGLSIKPAGGMETMKTDMSGAAAVIAAMSVIAKLQPSVRVVGLVCLTENLPGPSATKPGDVLRARNGKTMEVLNTDAEGRLVLADGLCLAVEEEADEIVDLATLTGACKMALGNDIAGLFTNDAALAEKIKNAASTVGELVWDLPMHDGYRKAIDSDIADLKNIGSGGAGAITAALFLREFVDAKPWVHLDIAGPARADSDSDYVGKGGTGFGVRTLIEYVRTASPQ